MRPVSPTFLAALRGAHRMVARVRVVTTWQTGTNPTGDELDIDSGDVQLAADAAIRGTLDLTVLGSWPTAAGRSSWPLSPYGNELFVERGVSYGNGTTEWVGQGYFRIDTTEQAVVVRDHREQAAVRLTASDRMAGIVDAKPTEPRQFAAATTYGEVFTALVTEVYPAAAVTFDDGLGSTEIGRPVVCDDDRYGFLRDLATARGKVFYFDHTGTPLVRSPAAITAPVWTVDEGRGGVLLDLAREMSRDGVYNAVVATGQGADTQTPARALVMDLDPTSPTYWFGRFGKKPRSYSSPLILDDNQARSAAAAILARSVGMPYSVSFGVIPNPALEPLDPVTIRTDLGDETHVIRQLTVPLNPERAMTAATRQTTTLEV